MVKRLRLLERPRLHRLLPRQHCRNTWSIKSLRIILLHPLPWMRVMPFLLKGPSLAFR